MAKIQLIVEVFDTVQVSEDQWRDGTYLETVDVEVPDWLGYGLRKGQTKGKKMRVIGAVSCEPASKVEFPTPDEGTLCGVVYVSKEEARGAGIETVVDTHVDRMRADLVAKLRAALEKE